MLIGVYAEKVCTPKLFTKGELRFNAVDWPGLKNWGTKSQATPTRAARKNTNVQEA